MMIIVVVLILVVMLIVSALTARPPQHVQELISDIRAPEHRGQPQDPAAA